MKMQNQWKRLLIGGAAALALTAGTIWTVENVSAANSTESWTANLSQQVMAFGGRGGHGGHGGGMGDGAMHDRGMQLRGAFLGDQQQYLADALGIPVEELQSAHETVRNALIDQAVVDGTLTQAQADQLKAGERLRMPGLRMKRGAELVDKTDLDARLAETLAITVEQLDAARESAREAAIADALAAGTITQEQVDLMAARQALHEYVHTQYADERPTATREELIQEALAAGSLTQAQADLLLSNAASMGPGGRGGLRHDGERGQRGPRMRGPNRENGTVPGVPQQDRNNETQENSSEGNL